ncbi:MAG: Uma2 family endonuclease [Beijerinckiaceae bacterium]
MNTIAGNVERPFRPGAVTAAEFERFTHSRPDDERWELIDGVLLMMASPTPVHQRIAGNLADLLNRALEARSEPLYAYQGVGLSVAKADSYRPEADVAVLPDNATYDRWQTDVRLVAEVLSESNREIDQEFKRKVYVAHDPCLYCLLVDQYVVSVEVWARRLDFKPVILRHLDDVLEITEFGFSQPLHAIYRGTPLSPLWKR